MCGIFGELRSREAGLSSRRFAEGALRALHHRGPDGSGTWEDPMCLLGHTRLAILDLSDDAAQPMASPSGRTHVVFNGEIYNYRELRDGLEAPAGGWGSTGDTRVLVDLFERFGLASLERLTGMFAMAVWRPQERELWLVRDRLGKKPVYYARTRDGLRFASEVPALLVDDAVERRTSMSRIAEFLQHGWIGAPRTGFTSIELLEPGHVLRVRAEGGTLRLEKLRYWNLPEASRFEGDEHEWLDVFGRTLEDAVRIRLRSDVPLGVFLSGGVDSSVVSLLAARSSAAKLHTFCVDFSNAEFSEGRFAREVAERIGANHQTLPLDELTAPDIDEVLSTYGDLHGDPSAIPTLAICRAARRHVTVALGGDGGDEVLGGYTRYQQTLRTVGTASRVPRWVANGVNLVGAAVPFWMRGATRLGRFSADLDRYYTRELWAYCPRHWPFVLRRSGEGPSWTDGVAEELHADRSRRGLIRLMACDATNYLPDDILVKVDRASMSVGLEVRAPFLDHRLFEHVMRADPRWLASSGATKLPLRRLYGADLPGHVFERRKMGFGVPLKEWLRTGLERTVVERLIASKRPVSELVDATAIRSLLRSHQLRLRDESTRLWHLLVLDAWLQRWRPSVDDTRSAAAE